jgi:ribosomal protein S18 acetylase RimI-like enzyme
MIATVVTTDDELKQIVELSRKNHRLYIDSDEKEKEGFVSWEYSFDLLKKMQDQQAHVFVKDGNRLVGYALVALKEAGLFHKDLAAMFSNLEEVMYNGKPLSTYKYYVMGQICIDKEYRGKGIFDMLYQQHKKLFKDRFDFVVTEISQSNTRSVRAHEKVGFKTIYTHKDSIDNWNVVLWDWK